MSVKSQEDLLAALADNDNGAIMPADIRDVVDTAFDLAETAASDLGEVVDAIPVLLRLDIEVDDTLPLLKTLTVSLVDFEDNPVTETPFAFVVDFLLGADEITVSAGTGATAVHPDDGGNFGIYTCAGGAANVEIVDEAEDTDGVFILRFQPIGEPFQLVGTQITNVEFANGG